MCLAFFTNIFSFMLTDIGLNQSRSLTYKINLGNFTAEYKFFFLSVYGGYRAFVNFWTSLMKFNIVNSNIRLIFETVNDAQTVHTDLRSSLT